MEIWKSELFEVSHLDSFWCRCCPSITLKLGPRKRLTKGSKASPSAFAHKPATYASGYPGKGDSWG